MSVVIQRTNPDKTNYGWRCAACRSVFDTPEEARECAEKDHATGRHRRAAARA